MNLKRNSISSPQRRLNKQPKAGKLLQKVIPNRPLATTIGRRFGRNATSSAMKTAKGGAHAHVNLVACVKPVSHALRVLLAKVESVVRAIAQRLLSPSKSPADFSAG